MTEPARRSTRRARRPAGGAARPARRRCRRGPPGRLRRPAAASSRRWTRCADRLAAAGPVGPLPDDLVDRLDRALRGGRRRAGQHRASRTVIPLRSPRRATRPRGMRLLQAAAGARPGARRRRAGGLGAGRARRRQHAGLRGQRRRAMPARPSATRRLPGERQRPRLDGGHPAGRPPRGCATGDLVPTTTSGLARASFRASAEASRPRASDGAPASWPSAPAGRLAGGAGPGRAARPSWPVSR